MSAQATLDRYAGRAATLGRELAELRVRRTGIADELADALLEGRDRDAEKARKNLAGLDVEIDARMRALGEVTAVRSRAAAAQAAADFDAAARVRHALAAEYVAALPKVRAHLLDLGRLNARFAEIAEDERSAWNAQRDAVETRGDQVTADSLPARFVPLSMPWLETAIRDVDTAIDAAQRDHLNER